MPDRPIEEQDLLALVDDQIDDHRRLEIEAWLAERPAEAARVMRDLRDRTALRLALAGRRPVPSPALTALVRQPLATRQVPWRRFAAVAAVVATAAVLGLTSTPPFVLRGGDPAYLDDAVQSYEASLVRVSMSSLPATPWMAPGDIRTAIRIRLPVLPPDWRLVDVQVFPSDDGPSAQLLIDAGAAGELSLFSSRTEGDGVVQPVVVRRDGETLAFWEIGGQSFVLIGDLSRERLHAVAMDLSDNRLL
ncbi:anti-sigma factor family protein [Brevundimonas sp. R86498]|uniref:anti-sigma factor family protein n=1 Tax=Brevundimonas sp. R86498 TaxID=3093845 RepID=UPI0037C700E2